MARIAGVDLPRNKRIEISLTYIFGVGRTTATGDLRERPMSEGGTRTDQLSESEIIKLREVIESVITRWKVIFVEK